MGLSYAHTYGTHGLRKSATLELYQAGCDDEMVKAATGHSGVEMVKRYAGSVRRMGLATRAPAARDVKEPNKQRT